MEIDDVIEKGHGLGEKGRDWKELGRKREYGVVVG
jgi:hypothetical protein